MNYYVYVIRTIKKPVITYVGWTNNLKKRIAKHNSGTGAKFTRGRKWRLLYFESLNSKNEAMKREYAIKKNKKMRLQFRLNTK